MAAALRLARYRNAGEQAARVGVQRVLENVFDRALFDDLPRIHHGDVVGDTGDDAEVMRDQDQRHAEFPLQLREQQQDLRLDRDVERRRRLVGDDKIGPAHQRHRDHHTLTQPARKLVRILPEATFRARDADLLQQKHRAIPRFPAGYASMLQHRFFELVANGEGRVQARHRLLENHADAVAAQLGHAAMRELQQVHAVEQDAVAGADRPLRQEPHQRQRGKGLAAAGLADDAQRFAHVDGEVDLLDRVQHSRRERNVDAQVLDLQQRAQFLCSGAKMSRAPSPSRLMASTSRKMAKPGSITR